MSDDLYLVAYEGPDRRVAGYAVEQAKKSGARLYVLHVLEWSPYTFLTQEELAERHKQRTQELERAQKAVLDPVLKSLSNEGVTVEGGIKYGNVVDVIVQTAKEKNASLIFVGRSGAGSVTTRIFGSVPMGLGQAAPVPTVIVP